MHDKLLNGNQIDYLTAEGRTLWYQLQDEHGLDPDLAFEVLLLLRDEEEILDLDRGNG